MRRSARTPTRYRRLMAPLVERSEPLLEDVLGPLGVPKNLAALAGFSLRSALPASVLARARVPGTAGAGALRGARGAFDGAADPAPDGFVRARPRSARPRCGVAARPRGVAATRRRARLVSAVTRRGGRDRAARGIAPRARRHAAGAARRDAARAARDRGELPARYRRRLERFRYGPGVFKLDWALDGPIPWRAPECAQAATVHLGGTLEEIVASEREPWRGGVAERPYVLVAQQSLFDPTRAPEGKHTAWAYCHVPNGSAVDMTDADRGAARAVRARVPRSRPRPVRDGAGGDGGAQPELRRRRHQRRRRRPAPVSRGRCAHAVRDAAPGRVPLLGVDAAGRRRPRHVWVPRCVSGASVTATGRYGGRRRRRLGRLPALAQGDGTATAARAPRLSRWSPASGHASPPDAAAGRSPPTSLVAFLLPRHPRCRASRAGHRRRALHRSADLRLVVRVVAARDPPRAQPDLHAPDLGARRVQPRLGDERARASRSRSRR